LENPGPCAGFFFRHNGKIFWVAKPFKIRHKRLMPTSDEYRVKAAEFNELAKRERKPLTRAQFENLALGYLRLADQAARNATLDLVYEPPSWRPGVQQQQQQPQPQTDPKKS
jgi:hypothetical protein